MRSTLRQGREARAAPDVAVGKGADLNAVRTGLAGLEDAGVAFSFRKAAGFPEDLSFGGEVDILLPRAGFRTADRVLRTSGLHRLRAAGHGPHRFYVTFADGCWVKLDVKLTERRLPLRPSPRRRSPGARRGTWLEHSRGALTFIRRHRPAALHRPGAIVAVLGVGDAVRSDVLRRLEEQIPFAVRLVDSREGAVRGRPARLKRRLYIYAAAWQGDVVLCWLPAANRVTGGGPGRTAVTDQRLTRRLHARPDVTVDLHALARSPVGQAPEVDVSVGIWEALRSRER